MNQAGVQADVRLPPSRLQYFRSFSPSPYNLSSILSIIPGSQFLNRLKKGSILNLSNMAEEAWPRETSRLAAGEKVPKYEIAAFPSPWGFLTSGYMVGLMITAILLHRIQNVVIPSPRRARHALYRTATTRLWERLHAAILPLDFSHTATRFVFHLPSVCFLSKMLVIWIVLVFQTCEVPLVFRDVQKGLIQGHLERLARWAVDKEMTQICWSTFCAVCGSFLIEGFIKAMDGLGRGGLPLGGSVNSLSPFHLVSYAFLLHVYSSPAAHGFHPADDSPSRPDKHVVITITIALIQLSMFHVLSTSKRLSKHRLIPTAVASLLSLLHFHATVFFHFTDLPPTRTATRRNPNPYMAVGPTYPLLNYVPNLFETALLGTIVLTVTVNAVAQLLVRGRVDHVLSGLGIFSGLPNDDGTHNGFFANLPYEEDFIIVLMRIGVASLEATGLRGWNNEVAPIQRPKITPRRVRASKSRLEFGHTMEDTYGQVRMGRMGVAQVQYGSTSVARTSATAWHKQDGYEVRNRALAWRPQLHSTRLRRGFDNDVRIIDLGHTGRSGLFSGPWSRNIVAFWQFLVVFGSVIRGLVVLVLDRAHRRVGDSRRGKRKNRQAAVEEERDVEDEESMNDDAMEADNEVYQRFLRGEDISDDEDEDAMEGNLSISDEEMSEEEDEEKLFQEREGEVVDLFTDLLRNPEVQESRTHINGSNGEMALAHLLHGSVAASRPLTRRVWNTLTQRGYLDSDNDDHLTYGDQQHALETRYYRGAEERDKEKGLEHICVVCMLESREIICWPCRCLAMCDGCRGRLAMRISGSKHRCPCCRQM